MGESGCTWVGMYVPSFVRLCFLPCVMVAEHSCMHLHVHRCGDVCDLENKFALNRYSGKAEFGVPHCIQGMTWGT
jgi:hypothetical protein